MEKTNKLVTTTLGHWIVLHGITRRNYLENLGCICYAPIHTHDNDDDNVPGENPAS